VPQLDTATGDWLRVEIERLWATAHELNELRALLAVRRGDIGLDIAASNEAERILGSTAAPAHRLEVGDSEPEVRAAVVAGGRAMGAVVRSTRWRSPGVIEVSQIVVRTLEGMLVS